MAVEIPDGLEVTGGRNLFTSAEVRTDNRRLMLKDALAILPFAVITNVR
jgi:hypothetical protein